MNGQMQPQPQVMMQIKCAKEGCGTDMVVNQPQLRIANFPDVSHLSFAHTKPEKCPNCGTAYLCLLQGVDQQGRLIMTWAPLEAKPSALIAPGTQANMEAAKKINDIKKTGN